MPPKPTAPASRVSQTCGSLKAPSSRRPLASASPGQLGTNASTIDSVTTPSTVTPQKAVRQPRFWPSQVAAGTPTTLATLRPSISDGDGPALAGGGRHADGEERGDTEVGAVGQAGGEAGDQQCAVRRGEGAGRVADREGHHQRHQQGAARQPGAEEGQDGRADDDAEGVGRDDVPAGGDRDLDAAGDLRQQAHGHELGGADREAAHRQGQDREAVVAGGHERAAGRGRGRRSSSSWALHSPRTGALDLFHDPGHAAHAVLEPGASGAVTARRAPR